MSDKLTKKDDKSSKKDDKKIAKDTGKKAASKKDSSNVQEEGKSHQIGG